ESRFAGLSPGHLYDVWIPLSIAPRLDQQRDIRRGPELVNRQNDAGSWWVTIVGRLKPETSLAQAQAAVSLDFRNGVLHGEKPMFKEADNPAIQLAPATKALVGLRADISDPLWLLMLAVGTVLLIACANV